MTARPEVSVIIPCYNRESTVREAVDSVLFQDHPSLEVIAVDDRSTDTTVDVLRGIDDPRLRVVTNTGPKGAGGARNFGLAQARGAWIAFHDSDDLWLEGKLSAQMALLAAHPESIAAYCAMDAIAGTEFAGVTVGLVPGANVPKLSGDILVPLLAGNFIAMPTLVVRADVLRTLGGFDTTLRALEDWDLILRIAAKGPIGYLPKTLALRRPSDNSISHLSDNWRIAVVYILKKHAELYRAHPAIRAGLQHRLAWSACRDGDLKVALQHQIRAAQACPWSLKYWILAGLRAMQAARS